MSSKKTPVKRKSIPTKKSARKKVASKAKPSKASKQQEESSNISEDKLRSMTHRAKHTPAIFKLPSKKQAPIVFSLEDVRRILKNRKAEETPIKKAVKKAPAKPKAKPIIEEPQKQRVLGAASINDILGIVSTPTPNTTKKSILRDETAVPNKWKRYYKLLMELRSHVKAELDIHSRDTIKRGTDDSSDDTRLSSHMADNGTNAFDRDFALAQLSNDKEALQEIDKAIERIFDGSYGICEITGEKISPERLEVVPFTRFSIQGQEIQEKMSKKKINRTGAFLNADMDDTIRFTDDDIDD